MIVEPIPGLGLAHGEWADDWTSVLVWNWCPANGLMVGPVFWFGTGALRMGDQYN